MDNSVDLLIVLIFKPQELLNIIVSLKEELPSLRREDGERDDGYGANAPRVQRL